MPTSHTEMAQSWLKDTAISHPEYNHDLITSVIDLIIKNKTDCNPEIPNALWEKSQCIAEQLLGLHADSASIASGLLLPFMQSKSIANETLRDKIPAEVIRLVNSTIKLSELEKIHDNKKEPTEKQLDKMRKLLLSMVDDIRIIPLKLIERVVTMEEVKNSPPHELIIYGRQIKNIYAPLANRIGYGELKWQLEDYAFRFANPQTYKDISKSLNMKRKERDTYISTVIDILCQELKKA